jgi:hypothetical protein
VARLFLFLIVIVVFTGCEIDSQEEQQPQKRPVLRILGAGLYDLSHLHAANMVGKEYGLSYEIVGGCTESNEFRDSLETHNKKVLAQLAHEFGVDWQKRFEAKADSMEFLISQVASFVQRETDYKKKEQDFENKGIIIDLWIEPTKEKDIFNVEAYKVSLLSADSNRNVYSSWTIDIAQRKVLNSICNNCR